MDPLDEDAVAFCKKFGFILLPDSGKMFMPMADVALVGNRRGAAPGGAASRQDGLGKGEV